VLLLDRYRLPERAEILDAGCGTGEISARLALRLPQARILGVDVLEAHLERARATHRDLGARLRFENRSVFGLGLPDASFDLSVCRHVLQSIPHPERVLRELVRVTRSGGWLHVIAEDYGMIHFERRRLDPDEFWRDGAQAFGEATGTDLRVGRRTPRIFAELGLRDVSVDYLVVDPLRVPRATFAAIWEAWRDGYAASVAEHTRFSRAEFTAHFEDMLATLRDPNGYGVWLVPVVAGRVP
jgi:SAM-dependent methyltransferase